MNKKYIMLGNGGHADVCRDIAKKGGYIEIGYVLGAKESVTTELDKSFLGNDEWLYKENGEKPFLINGIGANPKSKVRSNIFNKYSSLGFRFLTLIHPSSVVSENVIFGDGVQVMAGAIIQPNCLIKSNSIINTSASLDHDCKIGEGVHIAPGAILCGNVVVSDGGFVGASSCIIPNITIGKSAVIGAGITVRENIEKDLTYVGK